MLPHALNSESVYIEAVTSSKDYTIVLDSKIEPTLKKDTIENPIQLKPNYEVEIKKRAIAAQIENAYFEIKKDSILPPFKEKTINITYSNVFYLDNLTRFSSLKEFIIEVPNKVYFTDKDDDFKIHFRDGETNFEINEDPLIMVDGMLINNSNDLLKVDFKKIATIATYNQPYYFGNKLYGGLFIVKTIDKGFNEVSNEENKVKVAYKIPLEKVKNYFPNYINETSLNRIPDYRIQLFWQTNCTSLKNPFQFFTSAVEGTYEISIQGFTNNGDYINEKSLFKVL